MTTLDLGQTLSVGHDYRKEPHQDTNNMIEIMQGNLCIGRVHCGMGQDEYERAKHLANVWAAAPELLEGCEAALRYIRETFARVMPNFASAEDTTLADTSPVGAALIAAIAKAKGVQA